MSRGLASVTMTLGLAACLVVAGGAQHRNRAGTPGLVLPRLSHHVLAPGAEVLDGSPYREVEIDATITEQGSVRTGVARGGSRDQRQQAVDAVRQWRFAPATLNGGPVSVEGVVCVIAFGDRRLQPRLPPRPLTPDEQGLGRGAERAFAGSAIIPPAMRVRYNPPYTATLFRKLVRGEAEVLFVLLPDGTVGEARIVRALDAEADQLALAAAAGSVFAPAMKDGKPVAVLLNMAFTWGTR